MIAHATWTGTGYIKPKRFASKTQIPPQNPGVVPILLKFRFEYAYILRDENGMVLMPDGKWMPTFDFYLNEFGRVIGPQDFQAAFAEPFEKAWRVSCKAKRMDPMTERGTP